MNFSSISVAILPNVTHILVLLFSCLLPSLCPAQEFFAQRAHERSGIMHIVFAKDSKQMVTVGSNSTVIVWEFPSGKPIRNFTFRRGSGVGFRTFLPGGESFIVSLCRRSLVPADQGWQLHKCDIPSGKTSLIAESKLPEWPIGLLDEDRMVTQAAVDPIGEVRHQLKIINLRTKDQRVYIWEDPFEVLEISRSKKLIALRFTTEVIRIIELETGKLIFEFSLNVEKGGNGFAFLPGDKEFITVTFNQGEKIFTGNLAKKTLTPSKSLRCGNLEVGDVTSDGRVCVMMMSKRLLFWDAKTQEVLHTTGINRIWWHKVKFAPDGRSCVAGDTEGNLKIFQTPLTK